VRLAEVIVDAGLIDRHLERVAGLHRPAVPDGSVGGRALWLAVVLWVVQCRGVKPFSADEPNGPADGEALDPGDELVGLDHDFEFCPTSVTTTRLGVVARGSIVPLPGSVGIVGSRSISVLAASLGTVVGSTALVRRRLGSLFLVSGLSVGVRTLVGRPGFLGAQAPSQSHRHQATGCNQYTPPFVELGSRHRC